MPPTRERICRETSRKLAAIAAAASGTGPSSVRALIGLDGFVDEIIAVVDTRRTPTDYDPVRTIDALGRKVRAAAGRSGNFELVVKQHKLGGNGPIMAAALATAGVGVTYVGALGHPDPHPVFAPLCAAATCVGICDPGHTDALEFDDGKLMLGKYVGLADANWDNLVARVGGLPRLTELTAAASLVAMNNWTMLPFMTGVWDGFARDVLPNVPPTLPTGRRRTWFADLADPEKRMRDDLRGALDVLSCIETHADVVLGLNLKEAAQVAAALGAPSSGDDPALDRAAAAIRARMNVSAVVVHHRQAGTGIATAGGKTATFVGPFIKQPKISTGAGDHFNAGFCLAWTLGLAIDECLCIGAATAGYYVRTAQSPTLQTLATFIADLPEPE